MGFFCMLGIVGVFLNGFVLMLFCVAVLVEGRSDFCCPGFAIFLGLNVALVLWAFLL
jgi:hypothetical protein